MIAVNDFSGLISSACALAKAEASAATDSLDRCMDRLHRQHIKAHCSGSGASSSDPVANRLLGILRHQGFELAFRPLMLEKCLPGVAEKGGKFRPGIRGAHVNDAHSLNARARRLGIDQVGHFTGLDASPELLFG